MIICALVKHELMHISAPVKVLPKKQQQLDTPALCYLLFIFIILKLLKQLHFILQYKII